MKFKPKYRLTFLGKVVVFVFCVLTFDIFTCTIGYLKFYQKKGSVTNHNKYEQANNQSKSILSNKTKTYKKVQVNYLSDNKTGLDNSNNITATVYFAPDEITLSEDEDSKIDDFISKLDNYKNAYIEIDGNTADTSDIPNNNGSENDQRISFERAEAAAAYIKSKGVDMGRIILIANGSKYPAADNSTDYGRSKNRRVELSIKFSK